MMLSFTRSFIRDYRSLPLEIRKSVDMHWEQRLQAMWI
jgi:hypothetical protein